MRWLLILGLALDIAGAAIIAWPIVYARRGELREEGTMRWGRNAWVIIARTREQRFVRFGVLLLGVGFAIQLGAYVWSLDGALETGLAVVAVLALAALTLPTANSLANRGLPHYRERSGRSSAIQDVRDVYQVRELKDVPLFWRIAAGRELTRSETTLDAYISHGRWVADCSCSGGIVASPELDEAACTDCGTVFPIRFPEARPEIEKVLLARAEDKNRNWRPGETIGQLQAENAEHGVPALFVGGDVSERPPASFEK